jgi:hypothetical protein
LFVVIIAIIDLSKNIRNIEFGCFFSFLISLDHFELSWMTNLGAGDICLWIILLIVVCVGKKPTNKTGSFWLRMKLAVENVGCVQSARGQTRSPAQLIKKKRETFDPIAIRAVCGWVEGANHTHTHTHTLSQSISRCTRFSHHAPDFSIFFFISSGVLYICHPAGAQLGKRTIWKQMIIYLPNSLTLDTAAVSYSFSFFFFFFSTQRNWVWTCKCVCVCVCVQFSITLLYILYMVHGTQFQLWRGLSIPNACFMPSFILMFLHQINKTKITFQPKPTQRDKTTSRKLPLLLLLFFLFI